MLTRTSLFRLVFLSATAFAVVPFTASAQDAANAPLRAARLTSSQGTVTVTDGNNPPAAAQMNLPLLAGVQIATGDDGQAEIEFEDGSVARLTPNSTLSLDRLDIAPGQLFVTDLSLLRGLAYFELRATPEYVYSVNAGGDVVSPVENATVRIDFDQPPASISVMDGTAQVERANSFKVDVITGSTLREDASGAYSVTQQIAADSWDQWNADMDQQAAQQSSDATSVRDNYAGAQGYGWGDMDSSGTWYDVPGQGQVWQPYVADSDADFDPYGNGAWVWYPGTGYLWASAYPWGWTPYRCGGWSYYDNFGWGWAPGATCGGFGWGFGGGGVVVNIVRWPRGYRPIRVPVRGPGPIRPVVPVHIVADTHGGRQWNGPPQNRGPRQIAGVTARAIMPGHMSFAAGGGVNAGASLHRDFPIDRTTHTPALGLTSGRTPNVYRIGPGGGVPQNGQQQAQRPTTPDGRTRGLQPGNPPSAPQQQQAGRPVFVQPQHTAPQQQDGRQAFQPQQGAQPQTPRFTPQPSNQPVQQNNQQPRQTYSAPPQPQHTAPQHMDQNPQPRQNFSPPPQQPRYSPPPPPQPHFSAPPPPPSPPPAPHMSAPPPSSSAPAGHR